MGKEGWRWEEDSRWEERGEMGDALDAGRAEAKWWVEERRRPRVGGNAAPRCALSGRG